MQARCNSEGLREEEIIMDKFRLNINGKEVTGLQGQTILEVARENDIFIPTLCFDERTKVYGSCGICMCEVLGIRFKEVGKIHYLI